MKKLLVLMILFAMTLLLSGQEIKEYVQVNWRIIPLYAVDKNENPVLDLTLKDITLTVSGREVKQLVLYGRNVAVAKTTVTEAQTEAAPPRRLLFFIFDIALTDPQNIEQAKKIARDIMAASEENSYYLLLTVDPLHGLVFHGNIAEKSKALAILTERIKKAPLSESYHVKETYDIEVAPSDIGGKYTEEELEWLLQQRSVKYRRKCQLFFDSFKYLYYSIRTLSQSKVVYLFSQGVSSIFQRLNNEQDLSFYRLQLQQMANFLNLSGSALFVINPAMSDDEVGDSGRESMRYLAAASGGKYLAGTQKTIVNKVNNMSRAYYELAFAEDEKVKEDAMQVEVKARRRGVRLYSVNHIARRKLMAEMNDLEREMLVVNLLNNNPFVLLEMNVFKLIIKKVAESDSQETYAFYLPAELVSHSVELYKVWREPSGNIQKMAPTTFTPAATEIEVEIPKNETQSNLTLQLVLLDIAGNRAWVQ